MLQSLDTTPKQVILVEAFLEKIKKQPILLQTIHLTLQLQILLVTQILLQIQAAPSKLKMLTIKMSQITTKKNFSKEKS